LVDYDDGRGCEEEEEDGDEDDEKEKKKKKTRWMDTYPHLLAITHEPSCKESNLHLA